MRLLALCLASRFWSCSVRAVFLTRNLGLILRHAVIAPMEMLFFSTKIKKNIHVCSQSHYMDEEKYDKDTFWDNQCFVLDVPFTSELQFSFI